jgi:ABC-type glycerol-3-phosphate transport system substrate-binding protein
MSKKMFCVVGVFLIIGSVLFAGIPAEAKQKLAIWLGYGETLPAYEFVKKQFEQKYPDLEVEILTFKEEDIMYGFYTTFCANL